MIVLTFALDARKLLTKIYLFPFGLTEIFWLTYLVILKYLNMLRLLFMSMPFNHFYCFTIECLRLPGEYCFDFMSHADLIRYKTIAPITSWSCTFSRAFSCISLRVLIALILFNSCFDSLSKSEIPQRRTGARQKRL